MSRNQPPQQPGQEPWDRGYPADDQTSGGWPSAQPDAPSYDLMPTRPLTSMQVEPYNPEAGEPPLWQGSIGSAYGVAEAQPGAKQRRRGLSRRAVLIGAGAGAAGIGVAGAGLGYYLTNRTSAGGLGAPLTLSGPQSGQVGHLLRRAGFGPTPSDLSTYLGLGVQGTIDRLLNPASVQDDTDARISALHLNYTKPDDLVRFFMLHAIYSPRQLQEKMTLFWHGVLTSSYHDVGGMTKYHWMVEQNQLLRAKCLGRFDDLVHAMSIDPAMLWYLDGRNNSGRSPNENYSRELMELFTMGIGNYTQDDVHQGALALAGWTIRNSKVVYDPTRAYSGTVNFLGTSGKLGLDEVVRIVCAHPATGHHIAWRMWNFFAYDNPNDAELKPLVDAYYQHDHSISAMVRAMLTSPNFYSAKAYRARIKSPVEFVAGTIRGLGIETDALGISALLTAMGQVPLDPPNVAGWDGDKVSSAWLSTQTWMARVNFINQVLAAASGMRVGTGHAAVAAGNGAASGETVLQHVISAYKIQNTQALADFFITTLLDNTLADDRRAILHDVVSAPATDTQMLHLAGGTQVAATAVRTMLYLLMAMPEFQLG